MECLYFSHLKVQASNCSWINIMDLFHKLHSDFAVLLIHDVLVTILNFKFQTGSSYVFMLAVRKREKKQRDSIFDLEDSYTAHILSLLNQNVETRPYLDKQKAVMPLAERLYIQEYARF